MNRSFVRPGRVLLLAVSEEGARLATLLEPALEHAECWGNRLYAPGFDTWPDSLGRFVEDEWRDCAGLVFFMASGIAVRACAPCLSSKLEDPAVVVVDDAGRFAVSLLSGHEGQANRLAEDVAGVLGATPVVTTGTEARRRLVVGVGCRRGTPSARILEALDLALESAGRLREEVRQIASIDLKADEEGLMDAARRLDVPFAVVPRERILPLQEALRATTYAETVTGVASVCLPSAMLSSGSALPILPRLVHEGVTITLAEERCGRWGSAPGEAAI